jgi:hypothetical protein
MRDCKGLRGKTGQPPRKKKAITDDRKEKLSGIDSDLKSFLDNCIVPILVKDYTETVVHERVRELRRPKT